MFIVVFYSNCGFLNCKPGLARSRTLIHGHWPLCFQNPVLEIEDVEKICLMDFFDAFGFRLEGEAEGHPGPPHSVRINESDKISCHLISEPFRPLKFTIL